MLQFGTLYVCFCAGFMCPAGVPADSTGESVAGFPVRDWDEEAVTAGQIGDDGAIHRATGAKLQTVRNVSHSTPLLYSLFFCLSLLSTLKAVHSSGFSAVQLTGFFLPWSLTRSSG